MAESSENLCPASLREQLGELKDWNLLDSGTVIGKKFTFQDFHQTMAFVNAVAWIAHSLDHHPDLQVGYRTCSITCSTHRTGGVTSLDLQTAARIDALLSPNPPSSP